LLLSEKTGTGQLNFSTFPFGKYALLRTIQMIEAEKGYLN